MLTKGKAGKRAVKFLKKRNPSLSNQSFGAPGRRSLSGAPLGATSSTTISSKKDLTIVYLDYDVINYVCAFLEATGLNVPALYQVSEHHQHA